VSGGGIVDAGERIEVAVIGRRGHGGVAWQERHALRQWVPPESPLPAAPSAATDFEFVRIVDDGLDPQHAAVLVLVVHLDPLPLHPVLHACARPAALPVVRDLPREAAVELPAEERAHVLGAQAEGGVPQQPPVEGAQGGATPEEHVGGVLGLMRRPGVAIAFELVA